MPEQVVPLSELARDLPAPVDGWAAELDRRGVAVLEDDLGRAAVDRATARVLFAEHREQQEAVARRRAEIDRRAVEADRAFRAQLPRGVPVGATPEGVPVGIAMMLSDPMPGSRRESVVEHALRHPAGAIVFHAIEGHPSAEVGGGGS
jgi:hypothetical protein